MSADYVTITGVVADDPANPPPRYDIHEWFEKAQSDPQSQATKQVYLFLKGLSSFQDAKLVPSATSYYRVAGIHGLPNIKWNGVSSSKQSDRGYFCSHSEPTFPTWHRPYLALYEQTLQQHMLSALEKEPSDAFVLSPKSDWEAAVKNWRLPYWNYADHPTIPEIAANKSISVRGPQGKPVTIEPNPMWSYGPRLKNKNGEYLTWGELPDQLNFPLQNRNITNPWSLAKATSRYPKDEAEFVNGVSNTIKVSNAINAQGGTAKADWPDPDNPRLPLKDRNPWAHKASGTIREVVYRLLQDKYFRNWRTFASTKYYDAKDQKAPEWLSLEALHNVIHGLVGGHGKMSGQMSDASVAAFDPIFWHHHCFIDMIFASWQILTKDSHWFDNPLNNDRQKFPTEFSDTWLMPFHGKDSTGQTIEHTSDISKSTKALGYTYDRFLEKSSDVIPDASHVRRMMRQTVNQHFSTTRSEVLEMLPDKKTGNDLMINVRYNKFAVNDGESYWIHFFVGDVGEPEHYIENPDRVGSVYNFSAPYTKTGCANCEKQAKDRELVTGQVPITGAIVKDWLNTDVDDLPAESPFDETPIEQYLENHLQWRIISGSGEPIASESLADLKVFVLLGDAHHSADDTVQSTYSNYEPLWGATAGKPGGAQQGDT